MMVVSEMTAMPQSSDRLMCMIDLVPSWKPETIALLINKDLVKEETISLAPGQIRLLQKDDCTVLVEFASALECKQVKESYQGLAIPHTHGYHHYQFTSSHDDDDDDDEIIIHNNSPSTKIKVPSPPLHLQIMAVSPKELRRRLKSGTFESMAKDLKKKSKQQSKVWVHCSLVHKFLHSTLKGAPSRVCHYQEGVPVAKLWTDRLWKALRQIPPASSCSSSTDKNNNNTLSWPPLVKQRKGVQSSHYLTIRRQHPSHQDELWQLCRNLLLQSTTTLGGNSNTTIAYNALAITKNFSGSPHIDAHDQTYQHVIAVGDFEGGGRLCCELDNDGKEELQIDIHNRLGRMDGRKVHWVSGWEGVERYSVVYYSTAKEDWTEPVPQSTHIRWMQEKTEEMEGKGLG